MARGTEYSPEATLKWTERQRENARVILATHTTSDGSMTVDFYNDKDELIETFYQPPSP